MNTPIRRLFGVLILMFTALMVSTTWWTVVRADKLNREYASQNRRDLLRGIKIKRGDIRAADGSVIARSYKDSQGIYSRRYPQRELWGHPVGYSFTSRGQTELEAFYNHELAGGASVTDDILGQLVGSQEEGDDLRTTLDRGAQELAMNLLEQASPEEGGAAVVLDPKTGEVKVLASVPGYDPNTIKSTKAFNDLNSDELRKPLVNRALQFGYAPGSTMKVVTLVAALDSGKYQPDSLVDGTNNVKISGVPLPNDFGDSFGSIDLPTALAKSVNTVFAQIAEDLGGGIMRKYMERFGFDHKPQLDYPKGEMSAAGEYRNGELIPPTSRFVDVGRMGIGQDKLQVPALQMAQVAAAIANGGKLMKPHIGDRFLDADGRTSKTIDDETQSTVMSEETAAAVTQMMVGVVQNGTGTAAQIPGITVAGKTGTAETATGAGQKNNLWFIGFAPAEDPQVAFAVTVKDVVGFGGAVAAPIAKQLIEELVKVRELAAGTVVDDRYEIVTRLGSGGMADVYCAEDRQLGRRVALKVLYARFAEDDEFVERFRREASSAAGLQHQHVVSVYDRGEWEGTSYIAMEFVDGRTLKQIIQAEGPMEPLRAIDLIVQVLRAARFAHRRGVIHRDMKPHNVIVDGDGRAKVTDFGIARAGASDMTQTGSIMGTAQYLSPEQAQGHAVTPQSDLYSIGICLYEMLSGRIPFDGESAVTIALKQVNEAPVPPSHYNAAVPAVLEDAVLRALAKNPEERFPDADAFITALEDAKAQILAGNAPPAQSTAPFTAIAAPPPVAVAPVAGTEEVWAEPVTPPPGEDRGGGLGWLWVLLISALVVAAIVGALFLTGTLGGKKVKVPRVVGINQASAATVLHRAGLEVSFDAVTNDEDKGIVISQDVAPGTRVKEGTTIHASVSAGPGDEQIPTVDGLTRRAARKKLLDAGFEIREHRENSTEVAKEHVIRTQPTGGSTLEIGSVVDLYISDGPPDVDVPNVLGKQLDEARSTLEDEGFKVEIVDKETLDEEPGTVLAQSPASGQAPEGSTVTLTVAREPETIEVPDVVDETDSDAIRILQDAGFKISQERQDVEDLEQDGIVLAQDPEGDTDAKPGDTVTIIVGRFNPDLNPEGTDTTATTPEVVPPAEEGARR